MYRFLCLIVALALIRVCYTCPIGCSCIGSTLNCDLALTNGNMTSFVPNNTERVLLRNWGCWNLTWPTVSRLELFDTYYKCHKPILQLGNLKSLKFRMNRFYNHSGIMDIQAQLGVKDLYIIGAGKLTFENISAWLKGQRFQNLEILVIDRISSSNEDPTLTLPSTFFSVLREKRELRRLELINMHLIELDILASRCPPKLEYLSFKGSNINAVKMYFGASKTLRVCESLRTVDISQTVFRSMGWFNTNVLLNPSKHVKIVTNKMLNFVQYRFFFNVETFLVRRFIIFPLELRERFTIDTSDVKTRCRTVDVSYNRLRFVNFTFITHRDSGAEVYNLSFNTLKYLTPAFIQPGQFVKKLHLGSNDLHFMQLHYPRDFASLLHSYMNLEYVDLSENGLTVIPSKMFAQNERLVHLLLGNNRLTSISNLDLGVCFNLKYIGLNGNKLLLQDFSDIKPIQRLITTQVGLLRNESQESSAELKVNLTANTLRCTCANLDLQRWVLEYADVFDTTSDIPFFCRYDGKDYKLLTDEVEEISQSCLAKHKLRIGLIWTGSMFALICLLCGIGYFTKRKIMARQEIRVLVKNLQNNEFPLEFLIFLSHSSADDQLVINYVLPSLSKAMKDITKSNRDFIGFADKHFRPGHTIVEEVMGCIEKSAVVILVISKTYIASPWCDMEAKEAATQQKPVVLVLTEIIDENEMSLVMRQLFNRFARFKCFTNEEGKHEVVPTWATLSSSVLDLARAQMNG